MNDIALTLTRHAQWPDVTCGILTLPTGQAFYTLERPWRNNKVDLSCIPTGRYTCKRYNSPTHGPTFMVMGVPGRTLILFHVANFVHELKGCIALGLRRGIDNSIPCVRESGPAIVQFKKALEGGDEFQLVITGATL